MVRKSLALAVVAVVAVAAADAPHVPATAKRPVTDRYPGGLEVTDDYRWLEKLDDPEVQGWATAQDAATRAVLKDLPSAAAIHARVAELANAPSVDYGDIQRRGALLFAIKVQPPRNQPFLVVLTSPRDLAGERILVDPNALDPSGHTAIDYYEPSLDGKMVAVSLSQNGSESGNVHIYDVATGTALADEVPRANSGTAGGSLAWNGFGTGFYYTRHPAPGERPPADLDFYQQIFFHKIGTAASADSYAIGKEFPKIAESALETSKDGKHVLARVANGDGGEFAYYLADEAGRWTQIADFADAITSARFGQGGKLYLLSLKGSPHGKILEVPVAKPLLASAKVVVPEGEGVIRAVEPAAGRLYVTVLIGGPSELHIYDTAGKKLGVVPLPAVPSVDEVVALEGDDAMVKVQTFIEPSHWLVYHARTAKTERTPMAATFPADLSGYEVLRDTAKSKDGTQVPMSIVRRKGLPLDGKNATLLTGYGGYAISLTPGFVKGVTVFLEQGGVYVVANLRGGSELGEAWHNAGKLTKKQNVFDDFAACAQRLFEEKITNPRRLAIEGGSNGGLLMGAELTQDPDLYAVVVSHVGIYDMLRVELGANGVFNVTEYGTVSDAAQQAALHDYSPYHHVKDGTAYPPILMTTGLFDKRVEPWQSFKMTARLQAANPKGTVLLRVNTKAGHGIGSSLADRIDEDADVWAFVMKNLGVTYKPVGGRG